MRFAILISLSLVTGMPAGISQSLAKDAIAFVNSLSAEQKPLTLFSFDSEERFNFHYFPINDRKGLPLDQMTGAQKNAAFRLLNNALSDATVKKVNEIIELEIILKELENRKPDDDFRDPGKYYLAIFGTPGEKNIWGWRFEGHHVSFNFSAKENSIVAGTPGFLGSNPAIVQSGPKKGKEILRDEKEMALGLLRSLDERQLKMALISSDAPAEILTGNKRKAMIENPAGISYGQLNAAQREHLVQLIRLYINRYKKPFADRMMKEIENAGMDKIQFAWAGDQQTGLGHPHYYRIQGPTLIIEYDNTQNNANHVHTVVRDLRNDYGGDELQKHYQEKHH